METQASVRRRALGWCRNLAGWFPMLRPGLKALALAEEIAAGLGPNDGTVSAAHIRAVRVLIDDREQQRLVAAFASEQSGEWAAVCSDAGDVPALEDALAEGAARASILERRLPPKRRLIDLETGHAPQGASRDVLAVTLPAEAVWSIVDVVAANSELATVSSPVAWAKAVTAVARERRSVEHLRRVQTLVETLARQLPAPGYPRATALLVRSYRHAARRRDVAAKVAEQLLGIYVVEYARHDSARN